MNQKNLGDRETRLRIVAKDSLSTNIFLSAGAGSGKTTSLVKRVMALVGSGVPVSSIVAITFTREAAKMFYGRMSSELESKIETSKDPEEKSKYQKAFDEIDSAFFGTIDSFCRKLLLEHPAEAGITSDLNPLESAGDKRAIVDKGLRLLLASKSPPTLYDLYQDLEELDFYGEEFAQILLYVLEEDIFDLDLGEEPKEEMSPQMLTYIEDVQGLGILLKREYERRIILGNTWEQSVALSTQGSIKFYEKAIRFIDKVHPVNKLIFLENMVGAFNYKARQGKADKPDLLLERASELLANIYFGQIKLEYQELRYYKALTWAKGMRDSLLILGEKQGLISYNRSLKLLVEMLQRDRASGGHLLQYLQKKYKHYFIDELQDTNGLQSQLFDLLAGDGPGSLFIVGDEKQAIYRFRGGDVDNFKRIEDAMASKDQGETVLQLTCNFRSSEPLRQWFNAKFGEEGFFGQDFPLIEEAEKQTLYGEYKDKVIDGVYTFPVISKKQKSPKSLEIPTDEHIQVVRIIEKIKGKPVSHYDYKTNTMTTHNLEYSDILVLTYGKKKLNEYMAIFKEVGIPYSVVGSSNLQSSKSLAMMGRIIDYLAHPEDSYKEGVCLLGEPFSLWEKELYEYKLGKPASWVQGAKDFLEILSGELEGKTPASMYRKLMDRMMLIHMASIYNIEDASDTLYYGLELVREAERQGKICNLQALGQFIQEDLLVGSYEYELSLSGGAKGVRLMNLHKAKGLEGKVVILGDPGKSNGKNQAEKQYDYQNQRIKIFNITKKDSQGIPYGDIIVTDKFKDEKEGEEEKLAEEAMRLRYVAATRAENLLIIPTLYKNEGDGSQIPLKPIAGEVVEGKWSSLLTEGLENILDAKMSFSHLNPGKSKPSQEGIDQEDKQGTFDQEKSKNIKDIGDRQGSGEESLGQLIKDFHLPVLDGQESYQTINPSKVQIRGRDLEKAKEDSSIRTVDPIASRDPVASAGEKEKIDSLASKYHLAQENLEIQGLFDFDDEWQISLSKWQREGSVVGTLVHGLMEALVLKLPQILSKNEGQVLIENLLKLYQIPPEDKGFFLDTLWAVYNRMIAGGYPQDWAGEEVRCPQNLLEELATAQEIYTELAFSISAKKEEPLMKALIKELDIEEDKEGYLNGIIDLLYKKDDKYFVLDYKTNFSPQDLWHHYEAQIFLYKKVIKEIFSLDEEPKAYLYHIPARDESSLPKLLARESVQDDYGFISST